MNFSLKKALSDPLYRNSFIFFAGSFAASFLGYLYHLAMGRLLAPADYGIVASLLVVFLLLSVITTTILTVVMKYTAQYQARKDLPAINKISKKIGRYALVAGLIVTGLFVICSPWLSAFLNINSVLPVIAISGIFIFVFTTAVFRGILQGLQRFKALSITLVVESGVKLVAGIGLVLIGFYVLGAIVALVLAAAVGLWTAWWFVRRWKIQSNITKSESDYSQVDFRGMLVYSLPVLGFLLLATLIYNIDLLMVKHYFPATEAGYYAALSQLGKIIVFGTVAIAGVMFPMVAEKFEKKQNFRKVLWKSIGIVSLLSAIAIVVYFLAPKIVIGLLYGPEYLVAASLLGYVAIFMGLYSVTNVLIQFFMSVKSYGALYPLFAGCVAQIILITMFHQSLLQVILVMDISMAAIAIALFAYYGFFSQKLKRTLRTGTSL